MDPTPRDCVLLLEMEDDRFSDSCGSNMTTAIGQPMSVAGGTRGRALTLDGASCLSIADAPMLHAAEEVTLSAWVRPAVLTDTIAQGIASKRTDIGVETAYAMYIWTGNRIFVDIDDIGERAPTNQAIESSRWTLVTVVYDGGLALGDRVRVYLDGVLDVTLPEASASITPYPSPLYVGCQPGNQGYEFFHGLLDDVGIWTHAWDAVEVMTWYAATTP